MRLNKRLPFMLLASASLLLIPLLAMGFTDEVNWTIQDFIVAGCLLFGVTGIVEIVMRTIHKTSYKIILFGSISIVVLLIWIELAVGIFGTPFAGT